ncbi:MAG: c-type cytochrome [Steroidobacteraceae bacterium]|nr:c-type cytochrome [Deltaproteobacteria bacterium]
MSEQHDYDGIKYRDEKRSPGIFRLLFLALVVWGTIYTGYYLFSGWSSRSEADAAKKMIDDQKQAAHKAVEATVDGTSGSGHKVETYLAAGKQLFGDLCAACHGETAKGGVGPDLTVSKYKYGKARLDFAKSISEGRSGGMPAFNSQISKEQVESLVEYVLSLK